MDANRRNMLAGMGKAALAAASTAVLPRAFAMQAASADKKTGSGDMLKVRLLMNSPLSGPHAFFCLAQERGYFAAANLDVEFVAGDGAASVVPKIAQEGFDGGYGDLCALIKLAGLRPHDCPVAVHVAFNATPLTVGVRRDGPIRAPRDLEGKVIGGHPIDAAIEAFPAYASAAGIDPQRVSILRSTTSMTTLAKDAIAGHTDGVFGFVHTIIAALAAAGVDGRKELRFLEFRDVVPDLYGNALMMSPEFIRKHPDAVRALVAAVNRGIVETLADPQAALEATKRMAPKFEQHVDGPRLKGTLEVEMAHPDARKHGIGDVDDGRLNRSIALLAKSCRLPRTPTPREIFTRDFLPPLAQRARPLA